MAIASVATRGNAVDGASSTSLAISVTATVVAGQVLIMAVAAREAVAVSTITDIYGNRWYKLGDYAHTTAGTARVEAWVCRVECEVPSGESITVTWAGAIVDKYLAVWEYTVASGKTLGLDAAAVTSQVSAAAGFGSSAFSGLASASRLYLRVGAKQANATTAITASASYTTWALNSKSRASASAIMLRAEHRIVTATGSTSNPTLATSGNTAGLFFALVEADPPAVTAVDPTAQNMSVLQRDYVAAATWPGATSVGLSGSVTLGATYTTPAAGTTLNGHACCDFDGVLDQFVTTASAGGSGQTIGDLFSSSASGYDVVEFPSALVADPGVGSRFNAPGIADDSGATYWFRTVHTAGVTYGQTDSSVAAEATSATALATVTRYFIQWRFNGTHLFIRINNGVWVAVACGAIAAAGLLNDLRLGAAYGGTMRMKLWETGISPDFWSNDICDGIGVTMQDRYGESFGFVGAGGSSDVTLALTGIRTFAELGRGTIQALATMHPRGVRSRSRTGRATIAPSNVIALAGARAEARAGRSTILTVATLALSGVRTHPRPGLAVIAPGTVSMLLSGVGRTPRVGVSSFATLAVLAVSGVNAPSGVGRAVIQPGTLTLALAGLESRSRAGRAVVAPTSIITVSGVRADVGVGRVHVDAFYTIALAGVSSASVAGTGIVTTHATIALRGVSVRPRVGVSSIAPGSLTLTLVGARASTKPSSGIVTSLYTLAPAGVPVRPRASSGVVQTSTLLALAGVRGAVGVGRATVVPGDIALVLRGVVAQAKTGPVQFFVGGGAPITLALAGVAAPSALGPLTLATAVTVSPVGVRTYASTSPKRISASNTIAVFGVRARADAGLAAFDTSVTIAPAGVALDARVGISGLIVLEGQILALAGVPSPGRLGRLVVFVPADALVRISDRPLTAIRVRTAPLTSIVITDAASTHIRITHAPLTRIVMADDKTGEYDVGDEAIVTTSYEIASGFEDPSSVAFDVKPPTGAPYTLVHGVDAALVRDSKGHFHAKVPLAEHGTWEGYWVSTGAAAGGKPWKTKVRPRPF